MRARHAVVTVVLLALGCGREPGGEGDGTKSGTPLTGGAHDGLAGASSDDTRATRLAASRAAQTELVRGLAGAVVAAAGAGGAGAGDASGLVAKAVESLSGLPVVEARVAVEGAGASTRPRLAIAWRVTALNQGEAPLGKVVLGVPAVVADGRLELRTARVDGAVVSADFAPCAAALGGCWTLPAASPPGGRVTIELELAGPLPGVMPPVDAEALPDLARLAPVVDNVALAEAFGQASGPRVDGAGGADPQAGGGERGSGEGDLVLAGLWPRWLDGPVVGSLDVVLPRGGADRVVVGNATAVSEREEGGATEVRMVDLGGAEFIVVAGHGLGMANGEAGGRTLVARLPSDRASGRGVTGDDDLAAGGGGGRASEVLAMVREVLLASDLRVAPRSGGAGGLPPAPFVVVATATLDGRGVASGPGMVLVPRALVAPRGAVGRDDANPSSGTAVGTAAGTSAGIGGLLEGVLAHHPAPREALDLALATAVFALPWRGRGADAAAELALTEGLARARALALIGERRGDKARRRALELGLKLPYQLGRMRTEPDPVLGTVGAPWPRIAGPKAGLFFDALSRQLGAEVVEGLVSDLMATPRVTLQGLRDAVAKAAPRPDEARALMARWLDEAHGDSDVGQLRPELLLEYLVTDGAIGGLGEELMGRLRPEDLRGLLGGGGDGGDPALGMLGSALGKGELDLGLALSMAADLLGKDADPATKKWLELGKKLLGGPEAKRDALRGLIDELGQELGIPEGERARLNALGAQVMEAFEQELRAPSVDAKPAEDAPPGTAPTEP